MTPLHLTLALHYYARPQPYAEHEPEHADSLAVKSYRQALIEAGLLKKDDTVSGYASTEAMAVYIDALCKVPFPVQKWVIPE